MDNRRLTKIQLLVLVLSLSNVMASYKIFDFKNFSTDCLISEPDQFEFFIDRDYTSFMLLSFVTLAVLGHKMLLSCNRFSICF